VHHLLGSFLKAPGILGSGEFAPPLCLGKPLMPVLDICVGSLPAHQLHRFAITHVAHRIASVDFSFSTFIRDLIVNSAGSCMWKACRTPRRALHC
jgi:hypothetical protein